MPTRCHMGSHETTKIKRCIKATLAALSVLTRGALPAAGAAALTGGAGQRRWDAAAPRRAGGSGGRAGAKPRPWTPYRLVVVLPGGKRAERLPRHPGLRSLL